MGIVPYILVTLTSAWWTATWPQPWAAWWWTGSSSHTLNHFAGPYSNKRMFIYCIYRCREVSKIKRMQSGTEEAVTRGASFITLLVRKPQSSVAYPGCLFRIQDLNFFHPGSDFFPSRIRIKDFKYTGILTQKNDF